MTLQQLNDVIAIAETGSFNRAAERLYIAQPSLTGAIKELEKELGVILFNRSGRGATLTAEGVNFLPYARSVIMQYQNLLDAYGKAGGHRQKFAVSTQHYSFAVKAFSNLTRAYDVAEYEFAIRETRTQQVIDDVAAGRSEIGILYLSDFNRKVLTKILSENSLTFHHLVDCHAYVYLWSGHPLTKQKSISFDDLTPYPCLSFEQGENSNFYLAEEILSTNEYPRIIKCCDRATILNLMVGALGYTLCSGIICEELNGDDYVAIPYEADEANPNSTMEIGYLTRKNSLLSTLGEQYVQELQKYLQQEA
ncbi:MAG: LysR family transcriptional regulator [Clostridia bacterium]|nr:LysR family transcriptional regulator [Clostridia bacterium]